MNCWEGQLILQVLAGSQAYNLAGPQSDRDTRGICMPPKESLIGLQTFEQHQDEKGDNVVFGLPKFVRLALEGNPNLIETLFTEDVLYVNRFGERLRAERDSFLSRLVADRFGHYAFQQLKRLENHHRWWAEPPTEPRLADFGARLTERGNAEFPDAASRRSYEAAHKHWTHYQRWKKERNPARAQLEQQHGYDTKHAMHLCRLLLMGEEILSTGKVIVKRPDADFLRSVRGGHFQYGELLEWARQREANLQALRDSSPLPDQPDRVRVELVLMELTEEYFWPRSRQL
jgi:uncharacterized protein